MKIYEYQAKELFSEYGIPIPRSKLTCNIDEVVEAVKKLKDFPLVIKSQIKAGGRGKAGGIKFADSLEELKKLFISIIGSRLVTEQTTKIGEEVKKVLIECKLNIDKELYLSILSDRNLSCNVLIASKSGGVDIESVFKKSPDEIIKLFIDPLVGMQDYHFRNLLFFLNIPDKLKKQFRIILNNLYNMFIHLDCSLLEINPLIITKNEKIVALDAKVEIDSNSLYRQKRILEFVNYDGEDTLEIEASKYNLNYISLEGKGNIGSIVNGAGLAMATMDIIKMAGARPVNFLDVGGGATQEMVENGFKIILKNKNIKGIFINIFGGILRCDVFAKGIVDAVKSVGVKIPVIVRMEGTNVEEGNKILLSSDFNFIAVNNLKSAAKEISKISI